MATIVLAHGAWSAGWAWKKVRPLMQAAGHTFFTPTYTGLGERAHLAHPGVDLDTHIADVAAVLEFEDLSNVTVLGHSYGGMVATGVADKAPGRVARVIYLDAFAPRDGQSLFDLLGPKGEANMRAGAQREGEGWKIPPNPPSADTPLEDIAWTSRHRRPQPLKTFEQKIALKNPPSAARHYIYAKKNAPGDVFRQFADRAKTEPGWKLWEIDSSHSPNVTAPDALTTLLTEIMASK
jgi:pimeloyl-ACP methyl ester carboxylesterase